MKEILKQTNVSYRHTCGVLCKKWLVLGDFLNTGMKNKTLKVLKLYLIYTKITLAQAVKYFLTKQTILLLSFTEYLKQKQNIAFQPLSVIYKI